ncbi:MULTISPECIES: transporter substrate-binding domain-containing protein [unclassified Photobacterium]|uniref:transporter substrate-binding domain-containing protein n=1 Tax=unclassified Photobacterium TaxID=2628852 RepID=UPI001EDDD25F|nr:MULTISPECIES: transporter substrate-binding domain-containing protein [unclassified Photobacterium]MCG3862661.1 transporter substrate-binding domain-containing protein [Photobacterium sp. Ph6]MCG3874192.1 transporter substrate-binding domain-containing protein [Photobacterium sp. Ph5]
MKRFFAVFVTALSLFLTTSHAFAADKSTLEQIKERGTLRVGLSTFVPWAMRDKQGELIGFEVDVAKRVAKDAGVKVEFIPTAWDGIIPALLAGKFDVIIGGMSITPQRNLSVLFTTPYSHSGIQLAANKELAGDKLTIADYNKRSVTLAVRRGAVTVQAAKKYFPKAKLRQFDDEAQAFQEVLNGNAQAVLASTPKPEQMTLQYKDKLFLPFKERLSQGSEGFAIRQGDFNLLNFFNNWILLRTQDGWLQERYNYWFTTVDWQNQVKEGQ